MCKILEDMKNEAAREAAREASITSAIDTARYLNHSEEEVKKLVMERFKLDESTAESYLLKVGA